MIKIFEQDVSAAGTKILRNFIGLNAAGTAAFDEGFSYGVYVGTPTGTIGMPGSGNLIAGNDDGIYFASSRVRSTSGHVVQGNIIGVDALGRPLGNSGPGVRVDNVFNSTIGGTGNGEANLIANNQGSGVEIGFYPMSVRAAPASLRQSEPHPFEPHLQQRVRSRHRSDAVVLGHRHRERRRRR